MQRSMSTSLEIFDGLGRMVAMDVGPRSRSGRLAPNGKAEVGGGNHYALSTFTRNALNSGVTVVPSPM